MEDDDLELLRLAALKSIHAKKTQSNEKVGNAIKVVESINSVQSVTNSSYFPVVHPQIQTGSRIQTLVNPKTDNLALNEPYLPQRRDVVPPWIEQPDYVPYNPAQPRSIIPNVQLSPRSAAFVSQNNDILNRRKVNLSPDRDRSRSPVTPPHRYTPGRWSVSPPPYKNLNIRPNTYAHRSGSRSPIHRDKSPPLPQARKSRSPIPIKLRKSPFRKSLSGSPAHRIATDRQVSPNYPRNRSPIGRANNHKTYKHYSPSQGRSYNRKQMNMKRSPSPRSSNNGHHTLKRSRSPTNNSKRSRSKSPTRSFPSRLTRVERSGFNKRRSPVHNRKSNRVARGRRKPTPPPANRSPSPPSKRKNEKMEIVQQRNADEKKDFQSSEKTKDQKIDDETTGSKLNDDATMEVKLANDKSKECTEHELLPSSDDDKSSDENEDDGIDLFASEESESENEGRFKSNSSKNVRTNAITTVSFTKLGNSASSTLSDLNEIKSDKISTSSQRDRNDDRYKRGSNYSSRRDDRGNKKYGSSRGDDNRYGSNYKSKHISSTASIVPKVVDDKKKDDRSMFKPTFQSLQAEGKSEAVKSAAKPTISSRISPVKEKPSDKKLIVLKRTVDPTLEDQAEEEMERLPSTGDNATKKPVHLRLGAPTKTWKNKKSWRTEKVSQIFYVKYCFYYIL